MQEVEEIFNKNGFNPGSVLIDGKIHRFKGDGDSGTSCWYVVNEAKTSNGSSFYFGAIGDWHNRDRDVKFNTLSSAKYDDKDILEKAFRRVDRQVQESQIQVWEETSKITSDFWKQLPEQSNIDHPYLVRKQLNGLFGCKTELTPRGRNILVPMRDIHEKFWGYQRIQEDGKKFYFPGTKKLGSFHLIGEWGPKILICEGFATGASLHLSTDLPVVIAFDTSNLCETSVQVKHLHPQASLIICGDDDVFTPEPPGNMGRKKAEEAAKRAMGIAVFPKFSTLVPRETTDFNDLHCREGLEVVREQILGVGEGIKTFIKALGFRGPKYYYTSSHNKQINVLDSHSEVELLKLIPFKEYWHFNFPGPKGKIEWQEARAHWMFQCHEKGIFQSEKIRGSGVWLDQGRIVIHLGDRLLVDGRVCDIAFFKSQYHYELDVGFSHIHKKPLSIEDCVRLRSVCRMFRYANIHQMIFLGGWIALAPICGALGWRPHIWLTGEAGSGKTTIKDFIDRILDDGFKRVSVTGGTTEAGIRQRLKASALPVIFDEFEPDGKKNSERVSDTLDLIRQASSLQKGEILKGTQDQRGAAYQVCFMALVSSVKTSLLTEADRSRFTVIELEKNEATDAADAWKPIEMALNEIDGEYAERLVARMIKLIPVVVHNAKIGQQAFVRLGYSQRIGQQYGALVAGWRALESDSRWTLEEAVQFCQNINLKLETTVKHSENPNDCFDWLLDSSGRLDSKEFTFRKLLNMKPNLMGHEAEWIKEALDKYGLKILRNGNLFIPRRSPELIRLFSNSSWGHAWFQTLSRIKGVENKDRPKDTDRRSIYGISVPREMFHVEQS